jgi:ribose-phosphate pyrophosphokinase
MITIKNYSTQIEHVVQPTKFPDGTQQCWKLPKEILEVGEVQIIWHYESDTELLPVIQTAELLTTVRLHNGVSLVMPFLPYGRQDKKLSNETTFGLSTFLRTLCSFPFKEIITYDVHNMVYFKYNPKMFSLHVDKQVQEAIRLSKANLVCFPDKGASKRGYNVGSIPSFHLSKTRDQLTGNITGMKCDLPLNLEGKTILIVDDICDGGRTFIEAAKVLKDMGAANVDLYVTHGIFSNGVLVLTERDIRHIYTTDSFKTKAKLTDKVTVLKLEL